MRFDDCIEIVLQHEGGYVNHKDDRGGATNKGITQSVYDDFRIRKGQNRNPVVGISVPEVYEIYRKAYWDRVSGDNLPKPVDLIVFDSSVNSGPKRAARWLQQAVGVSQDGSIGPKTIKAVSDYCNQYGAKDLARRILEIREEFLDDIVDNNPSQAVFRKGWGNRLASLRTSINEAA